MIRVKRGQKENLPTGYPGEPLMCLDTGEFYVGGNHGNVLINGPWVTPEWYGAKRDGVTDDYAAIMAANAYARSSGKGVRFSNGTYAVGTAISLNTLDNHFHWFAEAGPYNTRLKYTGPATTNFVSIDGYAPTLAVNGLVCQMENLTLDGNGVAQNGLYLSFVCRSRFINITTTNVTKKTLVVTGGCVSTYFDSYRFSGNDEYHSPYPEIGISIESLTGSDWRESPAVWDSSVACVFKNTIIEAVTDTGIYIKEGNGNHFIANVSEAAPTGVRIGPSAVFNSFSFMDVEANSTASFYIEGTLNRFVGMNCSSVHILAGDDDPSFIGARKGGNVFIACPIYNLLIDSGADRNQFVGCYFVESVADSGTNTSYYGCYDITLARWKTIIPDLDIDNLDIGGNFSSPYGGLGSHENLCFYSEDFTDNGTAGWTWGLFDNWVYPTVTLDDAVAPNGTTTADKLARSNAYSCAAGSNRLAVTAGQVYTGSVWLKAGTATTVYLDFNTALDHDLVEAAADRTTCVLTSEWKRFSVTTTIPGSGVDRLEMSITFPAGTVGEYIYAWGGQIELGSVPSVYAKTTTTSNTRLGLLVNGDVYSGGVYRVDGVQVLGAQGAAVADATDASSTMARLNDLLAICRTHGIIDT